MDELQIEMVKEVKKFCLSKIEPFMEEDDQKGYFRFDIFNELGALGYTGIPISDEFGGAGLSYENYCHILEEISKVSVPYAVTLSVSIMVQSIIETHGTEKQKKKYLPDLTSGKGIGAFALSESNSGSDAGSLQITAKKAKDGYLLNGTKLWITSGGIAKTYIVMARTEVDGIDGVSAFIVEDGVKGFSFGKKENKMGWTISPTRELVFENAFIPEENILKNAGDGFKVAMEALDRGRFTIGAIGVGCAQRALDESVTYSLDRHQFGQPIFYFQGLQFMMAEMACEVEASRLLVLNAAKSFDLKQGSSKLASFAKLKATDTAMRVTTDAIQILGGVGYTKEYPVERFMRDAKGLQIVEGTNQIQKVIISKYLKREYGS